MPMNMLHHTPINNIYADEHMFFYIVPFIGAPLLKYETFKANGTKFTSRFSRTLTTV